MNVKNVRKEVLNMGNKAWTIFKYVATAIVAALSAVLGFN